MDEKKLFLIDAYAIIYRAFYALIRSPRVTSYGLNTSAVFGFCNTLDEVIKKYNPTHLAVCFDPPGGHTFRHEVYPEYKAGRDKQPEDITLSIPLIMEILEAMNIPAVEVDGYEADDVIGTLSRMAEAEGFDTIMLTPDKDYGQLVTDHVYQLRPALRGEGGEMRTPQVVCEKYGIPSPVNVIDILALEGDKSDNIPGCPGIGEKGAQTLVATWGTVENLIDNVDQLKGATRRKVQENAELIKFSKMLATIKTDVPMGDVTLESLRRREPDYSKLAEVYGKLEFRTFLRRLPQASQGAVEPAPQPKGDDGMGSLFDMVDEPQAMAPGYKHFDENECSYSRCNDVNSLIARALDARAVAVAVDAVGDSPMSMRVKGVAVAVAPCRAYYFATPDGSLKPLQPLFAQAGTMVGCHDIKTLMVLMKKEGIELDAPYFDTSLAHYLLQPEMKHQLGLVAAKYLGYASADFEMPSPARGKVPSLSDEEVTRRWCENADLTLRLWPVLVEEIRTQQLMPLLDDIELPLARVLAAMEFEGVRIDPMELNEQSKKLTARLHALEKEAYELAGEEFNVSSPAKVGEILFDKLQIDPKAKRTKKGAYSTTEEILEKYRATTPLAGVILEIRGLKKLLATYINALPALVNPTTGKIHTTYNQTVTATGRISSTNPNLQNIPIRTPDGREIRRAFIPDPGHLMLSADYSQIELRLIADISGDTDMIAAFGEGDDIHRATAAKIYHLPLEEVDDSKRRNAKTANFGIIYGISAFGLSERLGIPRSEAKELIEGYFRTYPHIKEYMEQSIEKARSEGYVTTIMGRRRMLPDINSRNAVVRGYAERNAINAPIQGSAADIIKRAMIDIYRAMEASGMKSKMLMQVHDELIFDIIPSELPTMQKLITTLMEDAYHGRVALEVASGVGANWLEAH